jgi:hypothetical protein
VSKYEQRASASRRVRIPQLPEVNKADDDFIWPGDAMPPPPQWRVDEIVPKIGIGLLVGWWGQCKTYVAILLAICVASRLVFAGRKVTGKRCGVLYIAAERYRQVHRRMYFMAKQMGIDWKECPILIRKGCPKLLNKNAKRQYVGLIEDANERLQERFPDVEIGLIVTDTLIRAAGWKDENSSAEAQQINDLISYISELFELFWLLVDHTKRNRKGSRGSTDKELSTDTMLTVNESILTLTKSTDGALEGTKFPFERKVHKIGDEGRTECTIEFGGKAVEATDADDKAHDNDVLEFMLENERPSFEEIRAGLDLKSKSVVQRIMERLLEKGLVYKSRQGPYDLTRQGKGTAEALSEDDE